MTKRAALPMLDELPIPADVRPGRGWTGQMRELADHIGAYAALRVIAAHGGEQVYVSRDPAASPFRDTIDADSAGIVADVYGGNRLLVPVGRTALNRARRAGVIAAVRAKAMSGADAQKIIGVSRTYISYLVNQTDEGIDAAPANDLRARRHDPRQHDLFSAKSAK